MKLIYNIAPKVDLITGVITLQENFCQDNLGFSQFREKFIAQIVDTRDKAVRDALIKLGWTPPPDDATRTTRPL